MKWLYSLLLFCNICFANQYHFVSIDSLIEQEVGRIILPQIYESLDMSITITPLPGMRAQYQATTGNSDGEIMRIYSYGVENKTVLRVPTPYYKLETMAFIRKGSGVEIKTVEDLKKYKVVKIRGVKHTNLVTKGHHSVTSLNNTDQIMRFLYKNRADVALTNTVDGLMAIARLGFEGELEPAGDPLVELDLYHYLHEKNRDLLPVIDAKFKTMIANGELQQLIFEAENALIDGQD